MRLPDFEAWAIFAAVAEHRSFTAAARVLGISKATASKAVTRLEARLGAALFHRSSRRLALTEAGRALAERARRIVAEGEAAEEAARGEAADAAGTVRLAAPMSFGLRHVAPVIAEFLAAHPGVAVDLHLSDQRVDLVAEGFDLALRIGALADSALKRRHLGEMTSRVVAAPGYLDATGRPTHPDDLADHRCLTYANLADPWRWRFSSGQASAVVAVTGPLIANSGDALLPALVAGLGVAVLPDFIVAGDLARGALEPILADWSGPPISLNLLMPPGGPRPRRVTLLADLLAERLRNICSAPRLAS